MFKILFSIIINLVGSLVQLICLPINAVITAALPDLSNKILQVNGVITNVFDNISWALGLIPPAITEVILFILTVEIAKHTIYISTHTLLKIWNIVQKIKFW